MPKGYGICNRFTDPNWHFAMSQFIDLELESEINLAEQPRKAHRDRPTYEKVIIEFCKKVPVGKLFNTNKILDSLERLLRKSDFDKAKWCGNMLGRYREREIVKEEWFGTPKKAVFENE